MSTQMSDVLDLFMSRVNDYRLNAIFVSSASSLNTYLEPWLLDSINDFDICTQDLTYTTTSGSVEGSFVVDLTMQHKLILSQIMVKYWLQKSVQDILQINNLIQDHDFKTFPAAQNLTAKKDYLNSVKEQISQILIDYGYKNNSWSQWRDQIFAI